MGSKSKGFLEPPFFSPWSCSSLPSFHKNPNLIRFNTLNMVMRVSEESVAVIGSKSKGFAEPPFSVLVLSFKCSAELVQVNSRLRSKESKRHCFSPFVSLNPDRHLYGSVLTSNEEAKDTRNWNYWSHIFTRTQRPTEPDALLLSEVLRIFQHSSTSKRHVKP